MDCLVCGVPTSRALHVAGHDILECESCSHRMLAPPGDAEQHVRATFDDAYFAGGGVGYPDYRAERELLIAHGARYARLLARARGGVGRVLDVGAAAGFVLRGFANEGWSVAGLEPNAGMAALARAELGVELEVARLEDWRPRERYDAVSVLQVVAHLCEPARVLAPLAAALVPGGLLLVETWNWKSTFARLFGRRWHEYAPPSARQWFTPQSLERWLAPAGFEPVARGRPKKRIAWAHARSLARERWAGSPLTWPFGLAERIVPEKAVLPYPAFDLFWALFRRVG